MIKEKWAVMGSGYHAYIKKLAPDFDAENSEVAVLNSFSRAKKCIDDMCEEQIRFYKNLRKRNRAERRKDFKEKT